jgi:hypothetical protein
MTRFLGYRLNHRRLRWGLAAGLASVLVAGLGWLAWSSPRPPAATAARDVTLEIPAREAPATTPAADMSAELSTEDPRGEAELPAEVERRLIRRVRHLASDELEGRGLGTQGIELAAQYIAQEFQQAGLQTNYGDGTPFQKFARSVKYGIGSRNELALEGPEGSRQDLALRQDFLPLSLSGSGRFSLPLVFVGYGITAPEADYDDYQSLQVTGKAVLVLRHGPRWLDRGRPRAVAENSRHVHLSNKVANALRHGAAAVVFCTDYRTCLSRQPAAGANSAAGASPPVDPSRYDALLGFQVNGADAKRQIPVLHAQRRFLEPAVRQGAGVELADLEARIDEQRMPQSCVLEGWKISGEVQLGQTARELKNVIAGLEGAGPLADETVVVGAHYDHLGYGGGGSLAGGRREIHNGADDNASGTALIIELGRQLAKRRQPLSRRVLFIGFTAEESGLIGSEHYVQSPVLPLRQTIAMVNADMVGYLRQERLEISGSGTAAEFPPLLSRLGSLHGFRLELDPSGDGPSDHASFCERRVPVLHLFTGLHEHYHRPTDDSDRLNYHGLRRITQFTRELVEALADAPRRPDFRGEAEEDWLVRRPSAKPTPAPAPPRPTTSGWLGQRASDGRGLVVRQLPKAGWAAQSGIRAGDRILQLGTRTVASLEELQTALDAVPRGQSASLQIVRGEVALELQLALP